MSRLSVDRLSVVLVREFVQNMTTVLEPVPQSDPRIGGMLDALEDLEAACNRLALEARTCIDRFNDPDPEAV